MEPAIQYRPLLYRCTAHTLNHVPVDTRKNVILELWKEISRLINNYKRLTKINKYIVKNACCSVPEPEVTSQIAYFIQPTVQTQVTVISDKGRRQIFTFKKFEPVNVSKVFFFLS